MRAGGRGRDRPSNARPARRIRVLNINVAMAVVVCASFGVIGVWAGPAMWPTQIVNLFAAATFASVPWLQRFGELVAPLTFILSANVVVLLVCWSVGTGSGV